VDQRLKLAGWLDFLVARLSSLTDSIKPKV
jgi:hypothetical protein